jgi:hypothetical protein
MGATGRTADGTLAVMGLRAMCVCGDAGVRQVVGDALAAAGLAVEHRTQVDEDPADFAVIVVDRAARQAAGDALRATAASVIVVGDDLQDDGLIALMLESRVSHLVGDPGDRDLGITSEKLVTGDLFGLEKYVAGGTDVHERAVANDADRRVAIDEICAWAEGIGARRPVVHRLQSVVDELLMNALVDAPRESRPTIAAPAVPARALLRWASDDRVIAVSVGDDYGALSQRDVIDHVRRARHERGRPRVDEEGAGLGLYLVLANVASLVVNIAPGRRTEVVCLFDVTRRERRAVESGVRSLHVFAAS